MHHPPPRPPARRLAALVLRPFIRPFFRRLEARVGPLDARLAAAEAGIAALGDAPPATAGLDDAIISALVDAVAASNAASRIVRREHEALAARIAEVTSSASIQAITAATGDLRAYVDRVAIRSDERDVAVHGRFRQIEERGEFIRREVLYEARYLHGETAVAPSAGADADAPGPWPSPLRVNVGAGHVPREGFVNVDLRPLPGIDVVADARRLPFAAGSVNELVAEHVVEHFPVEELRRVVLPHWRRVLSPGGTLRLVLPDGEALLAAYGDGTMTFAELARVTYGDQEYEGDFHYAMHARDGLAALLTEVGFADPRCVATGRRNGLAFEMEFEARAPAADER